MTTTKTIVWFRQDLRLTDNPALSYAASRGDIIPVFILDDDTPDMAALGGASQWWLHHSLLSLSSSLGDRLLVRRGRSQAVLTALIDQFDADTVVWNRLYEPWHRARDEGIKSALKEAGVAAKSFNGSLLWEPMAVLKKDKTPYKVFTPFYRKGCLSKPMPRFPVAKPATLTIAKGVTVDQQALDALGLMPTIPWYKTIAAQWQPGEDGAAERLQTFVGHAATRYREDRDRPAIKATSRLSPHLHFGEVSPNQAWYAIHAAFNNAFDDKNLDTFLSELGWREFSYYLLFHWPDIQHKNFNSKFDRFPWQTNPAHLKAWQTGHTGIPIVDAGMRELYQTGYMHNRVRMVVASFLVKNLLIDWRHGERWFWQTLLDADMASNAASWQWVAGSGADAAPYFRIFNPVLQGEKFDKEGKYVSQYCPELSQLPAKFIHQPWQAPQAVLQASGVELGQHYPLPIVDLKATRLRSLEAFSQLKETAQ
jgi:deoxyribodipyrimidine photo-lyase